MEICDTHHHPAGSCITNGNCKDCKKPCTPYCFPSVSKNREKRKLWIKALKRENKDKTAWLHGYSDRVCSVHFIDGIPTAANPVPTLRLRKRSSKIQERVVLPAAPKERKTEKDQQTLTDTTENCSNDKININCGCENTSSIIAIKHLYCKLESANQCLSDMC